MRSIKRYIVKCTSDVVTRAELILLVLVREKLSTLSVSKRCVFFNAIRMWETSRVFVFGSHGAARLGSICAARIGKLFLKCLFEPFKA
jgi:hypothetical protein